MTDIHGPTESDSHEIDPASWSRIETYRWFRRYARPHYAVTCRVDVSRLMRARRDSGRSPYIGCLHAIGHGLHAVPELRVRFRPNGKVVQHDRVALSFTVPLDNGGFGYSYQPYLEHFAAFDAAVRDTIARVKRSESLDGNSGRTDAVAYLSCLPWLDFTALDHAVPGPDDCIPRVSWGKIVPRPGQQDGYDMALNMQVHHAVTDGAHIGQFVEAVQAALDAA